MARDYAAIKGEERPLAYKAQKQECDGRDFSFAYKLPPYGAAVFDLWCGKCAMMKPIVEDIEKKYAGHVKFCGVDIEESPELADDFSSDIVPTFVFFKGGRAMTRSARPVSYGK